jgi:hypothetical protein
MCQSPSQTTRSKTSVHASIRRYIRRLPLQPQRGHVGWRLYTPHSTGIVFGATYILPGSHILLRSSWYMAIHDILPTNERLHRIALADSALCTHWGQIDTLSHRLADCGAGKAIWRWTQGHLATMLRTHTCHIPGDWPLLPRVSLWPPQKQGAVLWVLAHFVFYRVQHTTTPTLQDFADIMRRACWKAHPLPQRRKRVGGYLVVLGTAPPKNCS